MLRSSMISLTAATFLIQGCHQPAELDEIEQFIADARPQDLRQPDRVQEAARFSDPMSMIMFVVLPTITQLSYVEGEEMPVCPRLFDASDRATGIVDWRIEGDCEWQDETGQHRIEGSIVALGDKNGIEIEYLGFRHSTVSASQCAGQETSTAMTGVVRLPFGLVPPRNEEPEELPPGEEPEEGEEPGAGHYDIHLLVESSEPDEESCRLSKVVVAHDVTIDRTILDAEGPEGDADVSDAKGRVAVVMESRESASEPWQTDWTGAWRVSAESYGAATGE
ncbi:MAG TPA: hypothetical protein VNM90_11310, partial [Haliangium sp.]|nr:hypothetical protein [Haliangium sp.]